MKRHQKRTKQRKTIIITHSYSSSERMYLVNYEQKTIVLYIKIKIIAECKHKGKEYLIDRITNGRLQSDRTTICIDIVLFYRLNKEFKKNTNSCQNHKFRCSSTKYL